ncbi:MAG: ribonuclease P protein component [Candidatus Pacebacteria bacterium]|nr:ribonuclease P protein component [Candidatus Paceibacterota bacterium]
MLAKKNRVDTKIVEKVFKAGKFTNSTFLTLKYLPDFGSKTTRISVLAPKSVAKLAVDRNKLRRRGYQALKKHLALFPVGLVGVLVFKKSIDSVLEVENEIKIILNKIN